jgi:hypothetical protein
MSWCLVGSEMCIRDSLYPSRWWQVVEMMCGNVECGILEQRHKITLSRPKMLPRLGDFG